ncbi:glutaminyl-peptide cyclotransferase [Streptomyces himalayensis]|uniref:glutaminyl-peptide cyclotransferase n=1 Tax=Streptomyces himalayensis TaxID=2820085 RepID=UPI00286806BA|nr:glutaminyl-peptide cyclotransferase [Streptomyces himalayensis]
MTPIVTAAVLLTALLTSCAAAAEHGSPAAVAPVRAARGTEQLRPKVLETLPHDAEAFTQGLEMAGGTLYESTGIAGQSSVRAGLPGKSPTLRVTMPAPLFGEGITVLGRTLWQLTWQNGIAIERDARTLSELRRVSYQDDGWGLCHQRERNRLVTSNGSSRLTFRDPKTLAKQGDVAVTAHGRPVTALNELECVGDLVYANVLFTDRIVRIDASTGAVTGEIDATGLLPPNERVHGAVLNGVAAVPGTDQFLLTGKLWPKMFRVKFVSSPAPAVRQMPSER